MNSEQIEKALNCAFQLGQTYWAQADSESYAENRRSDTTRAAFETLKAQTIAGLASGEPVENK